MAYVSIASEKKLKVRNGRKMVLIAGVGTSPAVLTETVWALA